MISLLDVLCFPGFNQVKNEGSWKKELPDPQNFSGELFGPAQYLKCIHIAGKAAPPPGEAQKGTARAALLVSECALMLGGLALRAVLGVELHGLYLDSGSEKGPFGKGLCKKVQCSRDSRGFLEIASKTKGNPTTF